jgi:hypothetical protein
MISMPVVHSSQTVHLSSVKINTISKWTKNEFPLDPRHVGVPLVVPKMIFKPMVYLTQTVHLSCIEINTISKHTENDLPLDLRHLGVPSGVPKSDFRAYGTFGANRAPILRRD